MGYVEVLLNIMTVVTITFICNLLTVIIHSVETLVERVSKNCILTSHGRHLRNLKLFRGVARGVFRDRLQDILFLELYNELKFHRCH